MPRKAVWTEGQDTQIRRLRTEGASWDVIALALGLARWTVIERARAIGAERRPANAAVSLDESDRAPLHAGHADSWGAINRAPSWRTRRFRCPTPFADRGLIAVGGANPDAGFPVSSETTWPGTGWADDRAGFAVRRPSSMRSIRDNAGRT